MRIVRMWEAPTFLKHDQTNSLEMVLVDEKGCKIHATIQKQLLYLIQAKLIEGKIYKMSFFSVAHSSGSYCTTLHLYKPVFPDEDKDPKL